MRKIIAAINMTLDGFCDHTSMIADDEIHKHYNTLLSDSDLLIYGRTTYQLMESYWPHIVAEPTGNEPTDRFAVIIDRISKIVYSHTLTENDILQSAWKDTQLRNAIDKNEISDIKSRPGKDILVGSPSLIDAFLELDLADELQICVQPTILGKGLQLFKNIGERKNLRLIKTKTFGCGAIVLYYSFAK